MEYNNIKDNFPECTDMKNEIDDYTMKTLV